jgi:ABC-type branched-subunit amino acid transport system ATPase component
VRILQLALIFNMRVVMKHLAQAEAVARRVGLYAQLDKPAADLTVAGRKRLELARALATQPKRCF